MSIPAGKHWARVSRWALQATKDGVPKVAIEFEVLFDDGVERSTGRYGVRPDQAVKNTTELELTYSTLRRCGWLGTDLYELNKIDPPAGIVEIDVSYETKTGSDGKPVTYTNIRVLADSDPRKFAMSDADAKVTSARLRGALVAFDAKNGGAKTNLRQEALVPKARPVQTQNGPGPRSVAMPIDNFGPPPEDDGAADFPYP